MGIKLHKQIDQFLPKRAFKGGNTSLISERVSTCLATGLFSIHDVYCISGWLSGPVKLVMHFFIFACLRLFIHAFLVFTEPNNISAMQKILLRSSSYQINNQPPGGALKGSLSRGVPPARSNPNPRRYCRNVWVGMSRWDPGTLNFYQSYNSSADFCYPILD